MSDDLRDAKRVVLEFHGRLQAARSGAATPIFAESHSADHRYRGMRPFYDVAGTEALAATVWEPLRRAMPCLQRRVDIFFASRSGLGDEGAVWVVSMGNFLGDFTAPWLGIPATGKATYLPYAALYRVEGDGIVETVEFLDILAVLTQARLNPISDHQTGGHFMSPGPATHDGVLTGACDQRQTKTTHDLTVRMLTELAESYTSPADHLARYWNTDMTWFGPAGIGASLGFEGYRRGHTGPFEDRQEVVQIHDWEVSLAEGNFSAVMWWPCLTLRNTGGYLGVPANDALAEMRVIDLYRRDGDKLAENWIFIDMLHFLHQQGADLLQDLGGEL